MRRASLIRLVDILLCHCHENGDRLQAEGVGRPLASLDRNPEGPGVVRFGK